jgi:hypothetical protein
MRIRDPGWKKVGSGIRDKHPGSATLVKYLYHKIHILVYLEYQSVCPPPPPLPQASVSPPPPPNPELKGVGDTLACE